MTGEDRTRVVERVTCPRCSAPYAGALVHWRCPVCDTPAPDRPTLGLRAWEDPDDRMLAIVVAATLANVLLLAVLTVLVLR